MIGGPRRGHRRLRAQLRRPAAASPRCCPRRSPTCSSTARSGIAVGMATNMAPHNLVEVIGAARHLIANPTLLARRPDEVRPRPRPALRRQDRRARGHPRRLPHRPRQLPHPGHDPDRERSRPRRKGIVVTELPYLVGPEKVIEKIKDLVQAKKLQGIADVKDLTDRTHGLRLVIEIKNGFNPEAVLEQLYRLTPMEESFGINNVALVDGQPRTLGLKELLQGLRRLPHRRRPPPHRVPPGASARSGCTSSRACSSRSSTSTRSSRSSAPPTTPAAARARLMDVFDLSEPQATYILDLQLRRLTKFSRIELENEKAELERTDRGAAGDPRRREAAAQARLHRAGRRGQGARHAAAHRAAGVGRQRRPTADHAARGRRRPVLGAALLDRAAGPHRRPPSRSPRDGGRAQARRAWSAPCARPPAARSAWSRPRGRMVRLSALELPTLPPTNGAPSLSGGAPLAAYVDLPRGEEPLTIISLGAAVRRPRARHRGQGVVKRVTTDYPAHGDDWEVIAPQGRRRGRRRGRAARPARRTSSSSPPTPSCCASPRRACARRAAAAGGMAGIKLAAGASVPSSSARSTRRAETVVVTSSGSSGALPGTEPGSLKVTPYAEYPRQGPRHRRRALPPLPQGRGHPRARLGRRHAGPRRRRPTAWPSSCPAGRPAARRLGRPRRHGHRPDRRRLPARGGRRVTSGPAPGHACATGHGRRRAAPDACSVLLRRRTGSAPSARRPAPRFCRGGRADRALGPRAPRPSRTCRPRWAGGSTRPAPAGGGRLAADPRGPVRTPDAHHRCAAARHTSPSPARAVAARRPRPPSRPALLGVDFDAARGRGTARRSPPALPGAAAAEPVLLVCTNGRRDVCCAVRGRPVALEAARRRPGAVWESSHTGGHRFAPTGVLLPHGVTLARLDAALCAEVLESAAGRAGPRARPRPPARPGPKRPGAGPSGSRVLRASRDRRDVTGRAGQPRAGRSRRWHRCRGDPCRGDARRRPTLARGGRTGGDGRDAARIVRKNGNRYTRVAPAPVVTAWPVIQTLWKWVSVRVAEAR